MAYTDIANKEEKINELQKMLRYLSKYTNDPKLETPIDGIYSDYTEKIVSYFQGKYSLPVTGKVDYDTWDAIVSLFNLYSELYGKSVPISPFPDYTDYIITVGERSDLVYILQLMLNELRHIYDSYGHIPLNGRYDIALAHAVAEFQKATGLKQTGYVDRPTWNRLAREYNSIVHKDE